MLVNGGVCFVNLTQSRIKLEEGPSDEKVFPSDWSVGKLVGHFID